MSALWAGKFLIFLLPGLPPMDYDAAECYEEPDLWDDGDLLDDNVDPSQPCDSPLGTTACVSGQRHLLSPRRPPDPRRRFDAPWQVVVSMQTLLGTPATVRVMLGRWDRDSIELGDHDKDYLPLRCRHCRFFQNCHEDLAQHLQQHRCLFTAALQARTATPRAAEGGQPSTPQAAPAPKRRRRGRKDKTRPKTEESRTTRSSDFQEPATAHGNFNKNPPQPPADTPPTGPMDCAPGDNAPRPDGLADTTSGMAHLSLHPVGSD